MAIDINEILWKKHLQKLELLKVKLFRESLSNPNVGLYNIGLIRKFRDYYDFGIPASVFLLSNHLCNGNCFDSTFLLSRVLLDDEDTEDINIVLAEINTIRLNPFYIKQEKRDGYADHWVVERILKNGTNLIYDTSLGIVFDSDSWFDLEEPKIKTTLGKSKICETIKQIEEENPEDFKPKLESIVNLLPEVEKHYGDPNEEYAKASRLQREVEAFKDKMGYYIYCMNHEKEIETMKLEFKKKIEKKDEE